jgi:putative ABC transport system permease protein
MQTLLQDVRYGFRTLIRSPGFTGFAVIILALGIAANTAIFSIANVVLLHALPYRDADRLVMVWEDESSFGFPRDTPAPGNFFAWKSQNQVFEDMAATNDSSFNLTRDGNPEEILGQHATWNLFSVLGVQPALGRPFLSGEDRAGARPVAMLSHRLWVRRFGADPNIVGKEIWLNDEKHLIVGVMPQSFQFPDRDTEMWVPARFTDEDIVNHGSHYLRVVARLKRGVALASANADLAMVARRLGEQFPDSNAKAGTYAVPLREELAGNMHRAILVLLGAVGFVLLIACANVANLLLSRAAGRQREMALRMALGAGRPRVVRQLMTESLLLSCFAGGLGLMLSIWGTQFLASLIPAGFSPLNGTGLDARVLGFTLLASLATGVLFGIAPVLRVTRLELATALKQGGGRSGVGHGRSGMRDALVVSEVALAMILLTGASLMIRSFANLRNQDPGFRADHVLSVRTPTSSPRYENFARRTTFYDQVLARVGSLPGVVAAGYTTWVPLTNKGGATGIIIEGHPAPLPGEFPIPNVRVISKDYPRVLGMKLVAGRVFDDRDGAGTPLVTLINQTMARKWWPDEDPLRKRFKCPGENTAWITIVGIVGDVHQAGLDAPARPEAYFPYQQQIFFRPEYLTVKTAGEPMALSETVRQQIWAVDREQPVADAMPLGNLLDDDLSPWKMQASLLGGFAGLAILLAALGIYAVLSYAVTQRTNEIGVRLALGAQPGDILRTVFGQGFRLVLFGVALGIAGALALSRLISHLLFAVDSSDPVILAGVSLLLGVVSLAACYIPAKRAMRVDPIIALRYE